MTQQQTAQEQASTTTTEQPESAITERQLRDAHEVRIGLISSRGLRRILRGYFANKERARAHYTDPCNALPMKRGHAEYIAGLARVVAATSASIPNLNRDLITTAAILWPKKRGIKARTNQARLVNQLAREVGRVPPATIEAIQETLLGTNKEGRALQHAATMLNTHAQHDWYSKDEASE